MASVVVTLFELSGFRIHKKKTLLYFNSTPKNSLNLGVQLQSSRWWYEPESKCVHIQSLVLVCETVEQIMKAKQVSPVPAIAAAANSTMADITPPGTLLASVVSRSCGFPVEM